MNKLKVKYDKSLQKYHIEYEKLKDLHQFRYDYYSQINASSPLFILLETHLGSLNNPKPEEFSRIYEKTLQDFSIHYSLRPIEVREQKNLFGIFSIGNKQKIQDFSMAFFIQQDGLTRSMFDSLFNEYDLQVGYLPKRSQEEILDDVTKGYFSAETMPKYFEQSLYDSRLFNKFLATENRSGLES